MRRAILNMRPDATPDDFMTAARLAEKSEAGLTRVGQVVGWLCDGGTYGVKRTKTGVTVWQNKRQDAPSPRDGRQTEGDRHG